MLPSDEGLTPKPLPRLPPSWFISAGIKLRTLLHRAVDRVVPPELLLYERVTSLAVTHALGAVARLRVADALDEGPLTAAQLAARLNLDADALHRTLRLLATAGIFSLDASGRFSHTRRSRVLKAEHPSRTRDAAEYFTGGPNALAYAQYGDWLQTGKAPYESVHGMNVFTRFAQHPDEGETFNQVMMGITLLHARVIARLYPFGELTRLCDVGGGRGTLLSELLIHHPHLRGVLYDAPSVVESARGLFEQRGVSARAERVGGNFFESVPKGCDAYCLKNVLHDWEDETCLKILRNVRDACEPGARVLVFETLLESNDPDLYGSTADVHMGMICQGRERSRADYARLFEQAGLKPGRVFASSTIAVIEATR